MEPTDIYLEQEISAEFFFGNREAIRVCVRRDIKPGVLREIVEEASRLFLVACRDLMVPVQPEDDEINDVHLNLRYWHLENSSEMLMEQIEISACEIPKTAELAKSVASLANKVVPRFVEVLFTRKIELPTEDTK